MIATIPIIAFIFILVCPQYLSWLQSCSHDYMLAIPVSQHCLQLFSTSFKKYEIDIVCILGELKENGRLYICITTMSISNAEKIILLSKQNKHVENRPKRLPIGTLFPHSGYRGHKICCYGNVIYLRKRQRNLSFTVYALLFLVRYSSCCCSVSKV